MAIGIEIKKSERVLFCGSKWWGDPDLPEHMEYPVLEVDEGGEKYEYPLTFICQINCEDIAAYDKEGLLPHEGMLYFFAAIDELLGYGSPVPTVFGEWPKGHIVVKYAKSINFETFQSSMLVGDDNNSLTDPELEMVFSECEDKAFGMKLLGTPSESTDDENMVSLLQIVTDHEIGFECNGWKALNIMMKESDLRFGNWKKAKGYLIPE